MIEPLTKAELVQMEDDQEFRLAVVKNSFYHFLNFYLMESFELDPADFHKDIVETLESDDVYIAIIGFRGSAKSTFLEAFALWAMLTGRNEFIVYLGSTIDDAKMSIANIRDLIEENEDMQADFGINVEKRKKSLNEKWTESQLQLGDCTIVAKSKGQKIRGAKFKKARIDMIIGDDLEDVEDAKSEEKRAKTRQWFFREVLPATKQGTLATDIKIVLIGNLVHRDCLLKYLQKGKNVVVHEFGLFDKDGYISWPSLYPTLAHVEAEKEKVMLAGEGLGPVIWAREYLLEEADEEDLIIKPEDIQYYDPEMLQRPAISAGVGVDLAISKKQTADMTAMIPGKEVNDDEGLRKLLIMPNIVTKRMDFGETIKEAVDMEDVMPQGTRFYVEKVAYQQAAIEMMEKAGLAVTPMTVTKDKRARLISVSPHIKSGRVLFPRKGAEVLINSLIGFGIEKHDDDVDGLTHLISGMVKKKGGLIFG